MKKKVLKIPYVLVLGLFVSVFASITAIAANAERTVTKEGGSVTLTNVVEEIRIIDEGAGVGDTIYVADAPVKITITGDDFHSRIGLLPEAKLADDFFDIGASFEEIQLSQNVVELTKPGYYAVEVRFGSGYSYLNVAQLAIQVVNGSGDEPTSKDSPNDKQDGTASSVPARPTASKVLVNGKEVSFEAYNIGGNNYFKLRDLAAAVNGTEKQFDVGWDGANQAISLETGKAYTPVGGELALSATLAAKDAKPTDSKIYVNNVETQLIAYNIGGNNYFKLRDIAKIFNFGVAWDSKVNMIGIDTKSVYTEE